MSDIKELRRAVGAAAAVDAYLRAHRDEFPGIHVYQVWSRLEAELTRRVWSRLEAKLTRREEEVSNGSTRKSGRNRARFL